MRWVAFAERWPVEQDYYYVCWWLKRIRIRKIVPIIKNYHCGTCSLIIGNDNTFKEDLLWPMPTHWAEIED